MILVASCLLQSILVPTVVSDTLAGTLCGFQPSYDRVTVCADKGPWYDGCPQGYKRDVSFGYIGTDTYYASRQTVGVWYRTQSSSSLGLKGTICGMKFGNLNVPCDGHSVNDSCPNGYATFDVSTVFKYCQKTDPNVQDVPGTICGMRTFNNCNWGAKMCDTHEVPCNGYLLGFGSCPFGYTFYRGERLTSDPTGESKTELSICAKA